MSANLRHKNSLRTKQEIQQEMNQLIFQLGSIYANKELLADQELELTPKIKRLAKEQARPEGKDAPQSSEELQETLPPEAALIAEDAHVTQ